MNCFQRPQWGVTNGLIVCNNGLTLDLVLIATPTMSRKTEVVQPEPSEEMRRLATNIVGLRSA